MNKILFFGLFLALMPFIYAQTSHMMDSQPMDFTTNSLLENNDDRIAMVIPMVFILLVLVMWAVDFGTVGVALASSGSLLISNLMGLVSLSWSSILAYFIMGAILIYKLGDR